MACEYLAEKSPSQASLLTRDRLRYVYLTKIGTPAQNLHLGFDTGAGDFWVWSWLLPAYMLENRIYYNGSNSTSASQWSGQSFGVSYGLGSTYGLVWQDTVWVDSIGVSGNPIECIQNIAEFFVSTLTAVDGFLGLSNAYNDSESPVPQQTWMSYVMPHLAGKKNRRTNGAWADEGRTSFHCVARARWTRYDGIWVHQLVQIHRQYLVLTSHDYSWKWRRLLGFQLDRICYWI